MERLPPGPRDGRLVQTVAFHRDPLGALVRARDEFGPVFTLRFATYGPVVFAAVPGEIDRLTGADPERAHAGEARRDVLPFASPRSVFGGDDDAHQTARRRIAAVFAPEALARHEPAMRELADSHAASWPTGRPFRLLPRVRTLVDDIFVRLVLGVRSEDRARALVGAIRGMLETPGNPPLTLPGPGDGLLGAGGRLLFERRWKPVGELLEQEVVERRRAGDVGDDLVIDRLAASDESPAAVADELGSLLMAGQEPPAIALTHVLDSFARRPDADPSEPDPGIVAETLRLQPVALASLRKLVAPSEVGGFELAAGTSVAVPIPLAHRDAVAFPEPEEFRPDRFAGGGDLPDAYMPFGGGARRCIAEPLAYAEIRTVVPAVLRRLRLRPLSRAPERPVLRGTVLVPRRSALIVARAG